MPAGIEFSCPRCERLCRVAPEFAGRQGRCPGCHQVLEVPYSEPIEGSDTERLEEPHSGSGWRWLRSIPWQLLVSIPLLILAPLPALILGLFGLRRAKRQRAFVPLAWYLVILAGLNIAIGMTLYHLGFFEEPPPSAKVWFLVILVGLDSAIGVALHLLGFFEEPPPSARATRLQASEAPRRRAPGEQGDPESGSQEPRERGGA